MQSIVDATSAPVEALAGDLFALVAFLMKESSPALFAKLDEVGISLTQMKLLHLLDVAPEEHSLKELGDRMGCSLPGASRAVDGLLQRGLVERREDEHDRRIKRVRISDAGRRIVREVTAVRLDALQQFTSSLSDTERRKLAAALAPLAARVEVAAWLPKGSE
jgi:DNA-binding MarR family transcriptional regulator